MKLNELNELKPVTFSNDECLGYLEEMIISDLATEVEEKVYQDVKWFGKCNRKELNEVRRNMKKWYNEVF